MIFTPTILSGAYIIELEKREDERGYFARLFCADEFSKASLDARVVQCNVSYNTSKGTLRGMHFQKAPYAETRLVRCIRGRIYDVIIDLRGESATFKKWVGIELTPDNGRMMYVPQGFAHGFLTLEDTTEVFYQMSEYYRPDTAAGVRYNDPAFGITWPGEITVIAEKDKNYPDYI